jgi:hypothetical protein
MRHDHTSAPLALGTRPRADLLPHEVRARIKGRATRRLLTLGVVAVFVVSGGAVAAAHVEAAGTAAALARQQQQSQSILAQQAQYRRVNTVKGAIILALAAQRVGGATEIDWQDYVTGLTKLQPGDVDLTGVAVAAAGAPTPGGTAPAPAAANPGPASSTAASPAPTASTPIAQIALTAIVGDISTVADWLDALTNAPGYLTASAGPITQGSAGGAQASGGYTVTVTLQVGAKAFSNRFQPPPSASPVQSREDAGQPAGSAINTATQPGGDGR